MTAFGEYVEDGTASTLKERDYKDHTDLIAHALSTDGFVESKPLIFDAKRTIYNVDQDVSPTLRSMNFTRSHINGGGQLAVAFAQNTRDEVRLVGGDGSVVGALSADAGMKQTTYVAEPPCSVAATRWTVRRLTPRECERLQGFPDDYTLIPWRGKEASDAVRYKALGNAMACNVMRWIGTRIQMVEDLRSEAA
jgi:site-specific DNA-cytosine methylase